MAIGLGKMFGFHFAENFDYPYISKTITEFWRRWHISLSQWFRDYVYFPLGGSRSPSALRSIFNLLVVWLLTGIWHGANFTFVFWGLAYFVMLILEKYLLKPAQRKNRIIRIVWQVITLLCVNFNWVIFNSSSLKSGLRYCLSMFGIYVHRFSWDAAMQYYFREYGVYIILGILFSAPIMKTLREKVRIPGGAAVYEIAEVFVCGFIFLWAVSFVVIGAHNPFIYFNF